MTPCGHKKITKVRSAGPSKRSLGFLKLGHAPPGESKALTRIESDLLEGQVVSSRRVPRDGGMIKKQLIDLAVMQLVCRPAEGPKDL